MNERPPQEPFEAPRGELRLERVETPRRKKPAPKPEGYRLPSREEIEGGGYNIKEIFGELRAGGRKEMDTEHKKVLVFDREGELMADIPFKEWDAIIDAAEKMVAAKADREFYAGERAVLREWENEIDQAPRKMRGRNLEH